MSVCRNGGSSLPPYSGTTRAPGQLARRLHGRKGEHLSMTRAASTRSLIPTVRMRLLRLVARARNSERWTGIDRLLDQILDQREAREQVRVTKIIRQRSSNFRRAGSSKPSGASAMLPPKPRRPRR